MLRSDTRLSNLLILEFIAVMNVVFMKDISTKHRTYRTSFIKKIIDTFTK